MSVNIGSKIQQIRESANISTDDLAQASNISAEQISLIEKGDVAPNLSTLIKLSRSLGIRVGTLLDGAESAEPVITNGAKHEPYVNVARTYSDNDNLNFVSLAQRKSDRNMEPFIVDVEYVDEHDEKKSSHEGEEFLYILDGAVELRYGTKKYDMKKGDSIYYDSIVPHSLSSMQKDQKAQVLAVTYLPQ